MALYKVVDIATGEVLEEIQASCYTEALAKVLEKQNIKVEAKE